MSGVQSVVSILRNQPYREVDKRVKRELAGMTDPSKPNGKAILDFRARFVSELRKQAVWPR